MILVPKPPPMSGAITSTLNSGRPNMRARPFLIGERRLGRVPDAQPAGARLVLRHHAARLDRAAAAALDDEPLPRGRAPPARRRASGSPTTLDERAAARLSGTSAWTAGCPAPRPPRDRSTAGSGSYVDLDQADGVLGHVAVVGDHEGDRLADVAHLVRRPAAAGCAGASGRDAGSGAAPAGSRSPRSAAVRTRCTPGQRRAPARRRWPTIRAWACGTAQDRRRGARRAGRCRRRSSPARGAGAGPRCAGCARRSGGWSSDGRDRFAARDLSTAWLDPVPAGGAASGQLLARSAALSSGTASDVPRS